MLQLYSSWMDETYRRALFTNVDVKRTQRKKLTPRIATYNQEKARFHPDGQTAECFCAELTQKLEFLVLGSVSRCGRRQVVLSCEYVDGKGWGWGCGKEAGRVERNGLSLVHTLLRSNKPRLRNAIFSHPSNKLYIQQISGTLPNHFFPLQPLKKVASGRIELRRHNTEDVRFYFRHHLPEFKASKGQLSLISPCSTVCSLEVQLQKMI